MVHGHEYMENTHTQKKRKEKAKENQSGEHPGNDRMDMTGVFEIEHVGSTLQEGYLGSMKYYLRS